MMPRALAPLLLALLLSGCVTEPNPQPPPDRTPQAIAFRKGYLHVSFIVAAADADAWQRVQGVARARAPEAAEYARLHYQGPHPAHWLQGLRRAVTDYRRE